MTYETTNIFARILRGDIPCKTVYEDDMVLAFEDVAPQAPVHILVIPKGPYDSLSAMAEDGKDAEITALFRSMGRIATRLGLAETGYRVIVNTGADGGQEVPHLHFHLLGGGPLGPMMSGGPMMGSHSKGS